MTFIDDGEAETNRRAEERRLWLEERRLGVGGSDIDSVYNDPPYGCSRRLYYDKVDAPPDYPELEARLLRLGRDLEEFVADEYAALTGRKLALTGGPSVMEDLPHRRANPDRFIIESGPEDDCPVEAEGIGALEIKTMNDWVFRNATENGLPERHIRQLQWTMGVAGCAWGAFAIFDRSSADLEAFDVEFDPEMFDAMAEAVDTFWAAHVVPRTPPEPLPQEDGRCRECPWRVTCRGTHLAETARRFAGERPDRPEIEYFDTLELQEAIGEFLTAKAELDACQERIGAARGKILEAITDRDAEGIITNVREAVRGDGFRVYNRLVGKTTWDRKGLEALPPVLRIVGKSPAKVQALLAEQGIKARVITIRDKYRRTDPAGGGRPLRIYIS